MCTHTNATLIISLIKDDLLNSKLIYNLTAIGLDATDYHLHLSTTILDMMGFRHGRDWDEVFSLYLRLTNEAIRMHRDDPAVQLGALAKDIYQKLSKKLPGLTWPACLVFTRRQKN